MDIHGGACFVTPCSWLHVGCSECWAPSGLDFQGLVALQVVIVVCPAICFEGYESL